MPVGRGGALPRRPLHVNILPELAEHLSGEVWTTLADAASYKLSFDEESLTDHLQLELKRQHAKEIDIQHSGRAIAQGRRPGAQFPPPPSRR